MELARELLNYRKNGKAIIVNSVLENIDVLTEEELKDVLVRFKDLLHPVMTSVYIPSASMMRIIQEYAPNMKVQFKTGKSGGTPILPITCDEFFVGEMYFNSILEGLNPEWSDFQKYKYLYNSLGMMLSYDFDLQLDTEFSQVHDSYARNIFTSITRNWGVCTSFAASYDYLCYRAGLESEIVMEEEHDYIVISPDGLGDYLVDPTWDAAFVKFGIRTKNFAISKEQFIKNGHHLEETEAADYQIEELSEEEIEALDKSIGYLEKFGGIYKDNYVKELMNNLEGESLFEKISSFLEKIETMLAVGRATLSDYEKLLNYALSQNPILKKQVQVYDTTLRNQDRVLVVKVTENEKVKEYILKKGFDLNQSKYQI